MDLVVSKGNELKRIYIAVPSDLYFSSDFNLLSNLRSTTRFFTISVHHHIL